jgi:hypothetical protein
MFVAADLDLVVGGEGGKPRLDTLWKDKLRRCIFNVHHLLFHVSFFCRGHCETIGLDVLAAGGQGASIPSRGRL